MLSLEEAIETAWTAIDELLLGNDLATCVIGLGSGTTIVPFIQAIHKHQKYEDCIFIPTSMQAKALLDSLQLRQSDLNAHMTVDVCVDGCDAFDSTGDMIKGGGGCMLQEKLVAEASNKIIILAKQDKQCDFLLSNCTKMIPIEVHRFAVNAIKQKISIIYPKSEISIREGSGKLGPVLTDSGNVILDLHIHLTADTPRQVHEKLCSICGVLETGLFVGMNPIIVSFL